MQGSYVLRVVTRNRPLLFPDPVILLSNISTRVKGEGVSSYTFVK